ncbi:permease-like cell division protein FtsX [Eremococcus coleocola]|uniref:permease-like cell division protein FtsX n=1 Tax=Eremococcus coleocola TaxID=88132 RepID=UPI0004016BB1|nr:permease-like cell division protein FtsX [Eremococcus coleocola]
MIFRNFFRHIRDAFRNLFRNGWMTIATILTMTLTLIMIGGFVLLAQNIQNITQDIEGGVKIRTHIDLAADKDDEAKLKESIEALDHVSGVTYRTKEEEYQDLVAQMGSDFEMFSGDDNPFYNVFLVDVDDTANLESVTQAISKLPYASEVTYGKIDTQNLLSTIQIARTIIALVAAILIVIAILLISNTIRLTIAARQTELEIMRLVGATNRYIKAPFVYEGMFMGTLSAIFATALLYAIYNGIQSASVELFGARILSFTPLFPILWYIGAGLLIIGILLGNLGARRATRRFLQI